MKTQKSGARRGQKVSTTFAIYFLSRGSGVPAEAGDVQTRVQELLDDDRARGVSVSVETRRIGLEGERRMCVRYAQSADGARALERVRTIAKGADLVRVVEEPCTPPTTRSRKDLG